MIRALLIVLFALSTTASSTPFSEDEGIAREGLLSLAPVGSDAREAKSKLEAKGFQCHWLRNQHFSGLEGKHNYLYCDRSVLVGPLLTRRWQLALVHDSFVVKNAIFGIGLTGP